MRRPSSYSPSGVDDAAVRTYPPCSVDGGISRGHDAAVDLADGSGALTVLVVFDKSTSMEEPWDDQSKWEAASDAMLAGMSPRLNRLTVGAILFPQLGMCRVAPLEHPVQIPFLSGSAFVSTWRERACWPKDAWGTPLELALSMADGAIASASELGLTGSGFRVLVVTDGEPIARTSRRG